MEHSNKTLFAVATVLIALAIPFFLPGVMSETTDYQTLGTNTIVHDGVSPGAIVGESVNVDYSSSSLNVTAVISGNVLYATSPVPADWDMGDGTIYTDRTNVTHIFEKGNFTISVRAADGTSYLASVVVSSEALNGDLMTYLPEVLIILGIIALICAFLPIPFISRNPIVIFLGVVLIAIGLGLHFDVFTTIKDYFTGLM